MSELGSNQGQDENKNTPVFDSANLAEKQKAEHFANVEGAEARKKAAEREARVVEKRAEEVHKEAVKNAAKKADKEAGGSKGGILRFLFGGWHKIVTIVILLAIVIGLILLAVLVLQDNDDLVLERDQAAATISEEKYREAEEKRLGGSYNDAKKVFEDALEDCSREEKIYLTVKYAEYIAKYQYDANYAYSLITDIESEAKNDTEMERIKTGYSLVLVYTGVMYEE